MKRQAVDLLGSLAAKYAPKPVKRPKNAESLVVPEREDEESGSGRREDKGANKNVKEGDGTKLQPVRLSKIVAVDDRAFRRKEKDRKRSSLAAVPLPRVADRGEDADDADHGQEETMGIEDEDLGFIGIAQGTGKGYEEIGEPVAEEGQVVMHAQGEGDGDAGNLLVTTGSTAAATTAAVATATVAAAAAAAAAFTTVSGSFRKSAPGSDVTPSLAAGAPGTGGAGLLFSQMFAGVPSSLLQSRLQRALVLDIIGGSVAAPPQFPVALAGASPFLQTTTAPSNNSSGSNSGNNSSGSTSSSAAMLFKAKVAAKRTYLASAQGLPVVLSSAPGSSSASRGGIVEGPPLGLQAALKKSSSLYRHDGNLAPPKVTSSLRAALLALPETLVRERLYRDRWLGYVWSLISTTAHTAATTTAAAAAACGASAKSGSTNRTGGEGTFTLASLRDDQAKGKRLKLFSAPEPTTTAGATPATPQGMMAGDGVLPLSPPFLASKVLTPAFLAALDWTFAEVSVLRCLKRPELVGNKGFIVRRTAEHVTLLSYGHRPDNATTGGSASLIHVPRATSVFAVLFPDKDPSRRVGGAGTGPGSPFSSSLLLEVWGSLLTPARLRKSLMLS